MSLGAIALDGEPECCKTVLFKSTEAAVPSTRLSLCCAYREGPHPGRITFLCIPESGLAIGGPKSACAVQAETWLNKTAIGSSTPWWYKNRTYPRHLSIRNPHVGDKVTSLTMSYHSEFGFGVVHLALAKQCLNFPIGPWRKNKREEQRSQHFDGLFLRGPTVTRAVRLRIFNKGPRVKGIRAKSAMTWSNWFIARFVLSHVGHSPALHRRDICYYYVVVGQRATYAKHT